MPLLPLLLMFALALAAAEDKGCQKYYYFEQAGKT